MPSMSKELAMFLTLCVAEFLDKNTKGMCLSNMECEELEKAFIEGKFAKIEIFTKLKLQQT